MMLLLFMKKGSLMKMYKAVNYENVQFYSSNTSNRLHEHVSSSIIREILETIYNACC